MAKRHAIRALLPAVALLAGMAVAEGRAASVGTAELTQFHAVWLEPGLGLASPAAPALLNLPPGWMAGDAAVVIAAGGDWPPGLRDRLVAALLDAGAAVLELNPGQRGTPALAVALAMLGTVQGAGVVVAIGHGAAVGAAAGVATPDGRGFAAAVDLGPGRPVFLFGTAPAAEAWPARAPLFCDVLASAGAARGDEIDSACRAGLAALR